MPNTIADLELAITDIPHETANAIWQRLQIIANAYVADGYTVVLTQTTYTPDETADTEENE